MTIRRPRLAAIHRPGDSPSELAYPRLWRLVAFVALALGLALRFWRLDLTTFGRDEAAIARIAEDLARLGRVPLSGPVLSQGIPSAPHFLYLLAPIEALSRDPAFISGAIAAFNLAGIGATLWLGWRGFGPIAGVSAALLYAANPWAVFYARRIWQPDVLAPLAALLFVALDLAIVSRRIRWAGVTFPVAVFGVLVHPSFATLLPILFWPAGLLIVLRRWWLLLGGLAAAALIAIPTLVREVQTSWVDVASMRYYSSLHTWVDLEPGYDTLLLATGLGSPHDATLPPFDHAMPAWLVEAGAGLETLLFVIALALALWTLVRVGGAMRLRLVGLLAWLLLPVVLTIRHTLPLHLHYFLLSYPAMFLVLGLGCSWLLSQRGKLLRNVFAGCLAAIVVLQSVETVHGLSYVDSTSDPCYGPPLIGEESVAKEIVDFGSRTGATRATIEYELDDALPRGYLARADFGSIDVAGVGSFGLGASAGVPRTTAVRPTLTQTQSVDLTYADGLHLLGTAYADRPGKDQRISLALDWNVDDTATSNHPHVWDVGLVNAAGEEVFRKSGVDHVLGSLHGQHVVSWFTIDTYQTDDHFLPAGEYDIVVRLVETWTPATLSGVDAAGHQSEVLKVGRVTIGAPIRCVS